MATTPLGRHFPNSGPSPFPLLFPGTLFRRRGAGRQPDAEQPCAIDSFEGLEATLGGLPCGRPRWCRASDAHRPRWRPPWSPTSVSLRHPEQPPWSGDRVDLARALARGRRPEDAVADIASENPDWAPPSASVAEAAALMVSLGIRRLVVVDISGRPSRRHLDGRADDFLSDPRAHRPCTPNWPTSCCTAGAR